MSTGLAALAQPGQGGEGGGHKDMPLDYRNEIVTGDALDVMTEFPKNSVDVIITDPPYFLPAQHYSTRRTWPRSLCDLSMLEYFYREFFAQATRVLKPTGFLYVFCDGQSYPVFFALCYPFVRSVRPLVWDKTVSINGYSWRHQHEFILFGAMDQAPSVKTGDGDILTYRAVPVQDREHPAQKPWQLIAKLIGKSVPPGGVVLDPFAGSCVTAEASRNVGVNYICIEKDARYAAEGRARFSGAQRPLEELIVEQVHLEAVV